MVRLSENEHAVSWLTQFKSQDQNLAVELLDAINLISRDKFAEELKSHIQTIAQSINGPVGLYVECEVKKWKGTPNRLFKESRSKLKRAEGSGPKIVSPIWGRDQEIGSEGIIGQLVTELQREDQKKFFVNPGPKKIRGKKIRAFLLVTDFIGSGKRAENYLTAAWRVASVKSWVSLKYLSFHIVAFSGTDRGIKRVHSHKSKPQIHQILSCPTINSAFEVQKATDISNLCRKYDPDKKHDDEALGFHGTGALIAFSHGAPNNLPKILHKKIKGWRPLFPGRSTANIFGEVSDNNSLAIRLAKLRQSGITTCGWLSGRSRDAKSLLLITFVWYSLLAK